MTAYQQLQQQLRQQPKVWLITGVAGFIGSHLLQTLLELDQTVVGLDNFATGQRTHLQAVQQLVSPPRWARFRLIKGDIRAPGDCYRACDGVDHVLHQAALGSVKRSLTDPITTNNTNVCGFVNMLVAARDAQVESFTYATCSSTYGLPAHAPAVEEAHTGQPLSPYAATKQINELYADVFARSLGMHSIGLRYFNVYGPRQDPTNDHAYPVAQWIAALLRREPVHIDGSGNVLCDLTHVRDAVQATLLAALAPADARNEVYNVATGRSVQLLSLYEALKQAIAQTSETPTLPQPVLNLHLPADPDQHPTVSADIAKARERLGYSPGVPLEAGLVETLAWFLAHPPAQHSTLRSHSHSHTPTHTTGRHHSAHHPPT